MKFICNNALVFVTYLSITCTTEASRDTPFKTIKVKMQRITGCLKTNGPVVMADVKLNMDLKQMLFEVINCGTDKKSFKGLYRLIKVNKATKSRLILETKMIEKINTGSQSEENDLGNKKFYVTFRNEDGSFQEDLMEWIRGCTEKNHLLKYETDKLVRHDFRRIIKDSLRMYMTKEVDDDKSKSRLMILEWKGDKEDNTLRSLKVSMPRRKDTSKYNTGFKPEDDCIITAVKNPRSYWKHGYFVESIPTFTVEFCTKNGTGKKYERKIHYTKTHENVKNFILALSKYCRTHKRDDIFQGNWNTKVIKDCFNLDNEIYMKQKGARTVITGTRRLAEAERQ